MKTPDHHNSLTNRQRIEVWQAMCLWVTGHPLNPADGPLGWRQGSIPGVAVVNNPSVAEALTQKLGYPVSKHNVNSIRRDHDYTFTDPQSPRTKRSKGLKKAVLRAEVQGLRDAVIDGGLSIVRLTSAYTDLYEWATRQGFTGANRLAD